MAEIFVLVFFHNIILQFIIVIISGNNFILIYCLLVNIYIFLCIHVVTYSYTYLFLNHVVSGEELLNLRNNSRGLEFIVVFPWVGPLC